MVKFYPSLSDDLRDWALAQQVFFIASAPRFGAHVNISPKGLPAATFTVLDPNTACYIDATGSGAETIAHLYETQRATVMFCSFDKVPRILRLFCRGRVVEFDNPEFTILLRDMGKEAPPGARAVIVLEIFKVQTSCGYGVPLLSSHTPETIQPPTHLASTEAQIQSRLLDRETLGHWASNKVSSNGMTEYRALNNAKSLDNLPGLKAARRTRGEVLWVGELQAYLARLSAQWDAVVIGMLISLLAFAAVRLVDGSGRLNLLS